MGGCPHTHTSLSFNQLKRCATMSKSNDPYPTVANSKALLVEDDSGKFVLTSPVTKSEMYSLMLGMIEQDYIREGEITSPGMLRKYLSLKLAKKEHEVFAIIFLDNQNRVISYKELFMGTIDGASVYPREVVKSCLSHNAAAIIMVHNHPSGISDPSVSDKQITERLVNALSYVDIRVLDHIIVGGIESFSFAEAGLI